MKRVVAEQKAINAYRNAPCCICGQPINYQAADVDPMRFSVQHVIPRSVRPDLTWDTANMAAAHMRCNKSLGPNATPPAGINSRNW